MISAAADGSSARRLRRAPGLRAGATSTAAADARRECVTRTDDAPPYVPVRRKGASYVPYLDCTLQVRPEGREAQALRLRLRLSSTMSICLLRGGLGVAGVHVPISAWARATGVLFVELEYLEGLCVSISICALGLGSVARRGVPDWCVYRHRTDGAPPPAPVAKSDHRSLDQLMVGSQTPNPTSQ